MPTTITRRIKQHYQRCNSPRRRTAIMARWASIPALAELSPDAITDICGRPTTDQNPIVAALIALHRSGDADATTVLMTVLRPMVIASALKRSSGRFDDDVLDNDCAAVAHAVGTIDPSQEPVDSDGNPEVFLAYLGKRIGLSRRRLDPTTQRWLIRRQRGAGPRFILFQLDATSGEFDVRGDPTVDTGVEDEVLARMELEQISRVVASGAIPRSR